MAALFKALSVGLATFAAMAAGLSVAGAGTAQPNPVPAKSVVTLVQDGRFNPPGSCIGFNCGELRGGRVFQEKPAPAYKPGYVYRDSNIPTMRRNAPTYRRGGSIGHVEWCYSRYRSYRASDNSYKPSGRSRRVCISPYN